MTARRISVVLSLLLAAPALSGCLVIGATSMVAETAVRTTGTALETAGNVGSAVVRTAIPGDGEDDDDDHDHDHDHDRE
ncbi:hypothetical protein [Hyphobacterium indicum]|uniref:hypothetical protein n=1 Tax=Hyphobacterium indicum TaxID=2162714 RepID=UPI000D645695|nr:hypothetical protein [Hyphobacterium indicum]|tara:strand:- start:427 stop:663 length:237 start_codon:yes stop_codon:yes gene_type:complete